MHSIETRKKQSKARKRFYLNGGVHPNQGKHLSPETRKKIGESMTGDKHPQWKGGKIKTKNGYITVYAPDNLMANKIGYVAEHRLAMSEKIGRPLGSKEVVHHINGVRDDNRIENLVLTTNSAHISDHNSKRIWAERSKEKHRQKANRLRRDSKGKFINL